MDWNEISSAAATLFLIMDPLGNVPIFHALLSRVPPQRRRRVLARELCVALVVLLGVLFAGNAVLGFLGLSQPSLNISGGVLLFIIALRMIFPGRVEAPEEQGDDEPFIVPLAIPMLAGPSTIAVLLLLSSSRPDRLGQWSLALALAWLASAALLLASPRLMALLGTRGSRALERLMGMILVTLATQMLLNGIREFAASL